jgi:exo-beta-1,3-glucanase (GH17 family)
VIIAETGWPDKGQQVEDAQPSSDNAMKYFVSVQNWAQKKNVNVFYFSSFDEAWKIRQEGAVGPSWGLWDKDGALKYGVSK